MVAKTPYETCSVPLRDLDDLDLKMDMDLDYRKTKYRLTIIILILSILMLLAFITCILLLWYCGFFELSINIGKIARLLTLIFKQLKGKKDFPEIQPLAEQVISFWRAIK